jgi:hypothetical protein
MFDNASAPKAAKLSFSSAGKSALRSAITGNPAWPAYSRQNGKSSADLSVGDMLALAAAFGIDPAPYSTSQFNEGPKPMTHNAAEVLNLKVRFGNCETRMAEKARRLCFDIFGTADTKQSGQMTSRQYDTIAAICHEAETGQKRAFTGRRRRFRSNYNGNDSAQAHGGEESATEAKAEEKAAQVPPPPPNDLAAAIAAAIAGVLQNTMNTEAISALVDSKIQAAFASHGGPAVRIELKDTSGNVRTHDGLQHKAFKTLARMAAARQSNGFPVNIWLAGPAASGKTHAGQDLAKLMGLPFYGMGGKDTAFDVLGFIDGAGKYHGTPFRQAFEHGGVCQLDELDTWGNEAALSLQSALANDFCQFPDGIVTRHPNFICIAGANTWGHGATADYVGRTKLDGAFLSRFAKLSWDYDTDLESALSGNAAFAARVQKGRAS